MKKHWPNPVGYKYVTGPESDILHISLVCTWFYSSVALVICGSSTISKNNEQKRAKVVPTTLNLIGIPCQVWPWEDISCWTRDSVFGGAYVSLYAEMCVSCMKSPCKMRFRTILGFSCQCNCESLLVDPDMLPESSPTSGLIDMCVTLFNRGLWIFKQHQLLHTAIVLAHWLILVKAFLQSYWQCRFTCAFMNTHTETVIKVADVSWIDCP